MTPLAPPSAPALLPPLRQRVEEIKRAWSETGAPDTRAALATDPDLGTDKSAVLDLAFEEFTLRRGNGEALDPDEFCDRFPSFRSSLRGLLNLNELIDQLGVLPDLAAWPQPGESVGPFRLRRELGRGAFARVYLAEETTAGDRPVVVKLLRHATAEPHTLGPLSHPGIVPVLSADPEPGPDGFARIVMPFLGCATLHDLLDHAYPRADSAPPARADVILRATRCRARPDDPPLDAAPDPVLARGTYAQGVRFLARRLAEALAHVHARGVVHRDLKPSNVLLGPGGRPLLLDFNLCADDNVPGGRFGGTVPYMAPEQLRAMAARRAPADDKPDGRTDVYALGVLLYELLTGRHPFGPVPRDLSAETMLRRQRAGCAPVRARNPRVEPRFAALVERCLEFEAARRPAGAAGVLEELDRQERAARRKRRWFGVARGLVLAGALLGMAAAMRPDPPDWRKEAEQASAAKDFEKAGDLWGKVLEDEKNRADPRPWLGRGLARLRQGERLIQASQKAKDKRVHDDACGLLKDAADDLLQAERRLQRAGDEATADKVRASRAYALTLGENNGEAFGLYNELIELKGHRSAWLYNNRGFCQRRLGNGAAALADFDKAIDISPELQAARYNRAKICLEAETLRPMTEALKDIEQALVLGPVSRELLRDAAKLHAKAAKEFKGRDEAERSAARARTLERLAAKEGAETVTPKVVDPLADW